MSSAQLDIQQPLPGHDDASQEADAPFALKQQVAERLAAHRARRRTNAANSSAPIPIATPAKARAARIAAAVAERYANSPSYRAFLAAEAETAIRQAEAAAEVAAITAQAVADAQYSLLAELDEISSAPERTTPPASVSVLIPASAPETPAFTLTPPAEATHAAPPPAQPAPAQHIPGAGVTVRLHEDVRLDPPQPPTARTVQAAAHLEDESIALDEEIAFRQSPVFEETVPPVDIPANLIEFPRQLVAARRARPRLAEGPLLEEAERTAHQDQASAQLRIFEVEPTQLSTAPVVESVVPEWSSILLDAQPHIQAEPVAEPAAAAAPIPLYTAAFNLRIMAAAVDACIVTASLIAFLAVFTLTSGRLPIAQLALPIVALIAAGAFFLFAGLYQLLFFTFADATPGMRYARIGLCTFDDENPTRSALRRRTLALLLSTAPLGIGILWAAIDSDGLGWHDRISRIYQRSY